jgi:hypothetical protein
VDGDGFDSKFGPIDITRAFPRGLTFFGETYRSIFIQDFGIVNLHDLESDFFNPPSLIVYEAQPGLGEAREPSPGGTSRGSKEIWYDVAPASSP